MFRKSPLSLIFAVFVLFIFVILFVIFVMPDNGGGNFEMVVIIAGTFLRFFPFFVILIYFIYRKWLRQHWLLALIVLALSIAPYQLLFNSSSFFID